MRTEYIARISYGKDSLKMLDVIWTRGFPLDRITTTDVWATDTISANLPPMDEFKKRMDEKIYQLYGIRVEHLCARNNDGTKKTYEQMFYHVPQRRSQNIQVERERERESKPHGTGERESIEGHETRLGYCHGASICRGYFEKKLTVARTIAARDHKGLSNQVMNGVALYKVET